MRENSTWARVERVGDPASLSQLSHSRPQGCGTGTHIPEGFCSCPNSAASPMKPAPRWPFPPGQSGRRWRTSGGGGCGRGPSTRRDLKTSHLRRVQKAQACQTRSGLSISLLQTWPRHTSREQGSSVVSQARQREPIDGQGTMRPDSSWETSANLCLRPRMGADRDKETCPEN